ncbi:MAG: sulfurtransferase [Myxococcales bacterium]|nr:sulfurtransferase [Myxococcales bacterium]
MEAVTNIAAYKFANLGELRALREDLQGFCKARALKGTILLAPEGINLFIAGDKQGADDLLAKLRAVPGLGTLAAKYSESAAQPFNRMLVRIKKEIIAFGIDGIDPANKPSPKLAPAELKRWLDDGKPVLMLDTRNDYEYKIGTFAGAKTLPIDHFRQFPAAVESLAKAGEITPDTPIVMFCTGGIRCEKAGPYMAQAGYKHVYQLDGGILKYFEDVGSAHYTGECFVFDHRVGIDAHLQPTETAQCFACMAPVTAIEQRDPRYIKGESCPHCFVTSETHLAAERVAKAAALRAFAKALPGSEPYDNFKPFKITQAFDGQPIGAFLRGVFPHVDVATWDVAFAHGRIIDEEHEPIASDTIVRAGERFFRIDPATREPDVCADIELLTSDDVMLVVGKPAPLPMHPSGRFNRNTLQHMLAQVYAPQRPRPVHRLDANTSGLVVFARSRHAAHKLQQQFERGDVRKQYLARIAGHPPQDTFVVEAPISTGAGLAGSRTVDDEGGQAARTEFAVLARLPDGTAMVTARPITGRTNQIRIHAWQLGMPVVGDPTYLPGGRIADAQTLPVGAPPMCLHAHTLSFRHPVTDAPLAFTAPPPAWAVVP